VTWEIIHWHNDRVASSAVSVRTHLLLGTWSLFRKRVETFGISRKTGVSNEWSRSTYAHRNMVLVCYYGNPIPTWNHTAIVDCHNWFCQCQDVSTNNINKVYTTSASSSQLKNAKTGRYDDLLTNAKRLKARWYNQGTTQMKITNGITYRWKLIKDFDEITWEC
jgi:hypothetical protein